MKNSILLALLFLFPLSPFAECTIRCKVNYLISDQPQNKSVIIGYTPGVGRYGKSPIISGSGSLPPYSTDNSVWSDKYIVDASFYSGYELNNEKYPDNAIVAIIKWSNGGFSTIQISKWSTKLKYMTENEVLYDSNNNRITQMLGYDSENKLWKIEFN